MFLVFPGYTWIAMKYSLKHKNYAIHQENISRLSNSEKKHEVFKSSVVIGGTARNVEKHFPKVMKNIWISQICFLKVKLLYIMIFLEEIIRYQCYKSMQKRPLVDLN